MDKINIGIEFDQRKEISSGLGRLLADTYTLYLKTHYFHWNVTGPNFQQLHSLFEKHYQEMADAVDDIAERIRALGFPSPGTYAEFLKVSSIKETVFIPSADEMVQFLVEGNEATVRTARALLPLVEKVGDQPTIDLIAKRMHLHEKNAWMLRSHLMSGMGSGTETESKRKVS